MRVSSVERELGQGRQDGLIPIEVFLLSCLHHPNIVKVFYLTHFIYNTTRKYNTNVCTYQGVERESWVKDDKMGMISMEVFLLSRLHQPNIIKVTLVLKYYAV